MSETTAYPSVPEELVEAVRERAAGYGARHPEGCYCGLCALVRAVRHPEHKGKRRKPVKCPRCGYRWQAVDNPRRPAGHSIRCPACRHRVAAIDL